MSCLKMSISVLIALSATPLLCGAASDMLETPFLGAGECSKLRGQELRSII